MTVTRFDEPHTTDVQPRIVRWLYEVGTRIILPQYVESGGRIAVVCKT